MGIERREFLRVACKGAIAEIFVQGASVGMHSVEDVSDGGMFLASPSPVLPVQTKVEVQIVDSKPPVRCRAEVVHVVRPGESRPSGYALKIEPGSFDMVAAVASAVRSPPPPAPEPAPVKPPSPAKGSTPADNPQVLIAINSAGMRYALCEGLKAFRVPAAETTPQAFNQALVKGLRVALLEMTTIAEGIEGIRALHAVAPRARALMYTRKLPDAQGRKDLQASGADQLVLPPLDPFDVLKRLFTKARGDLNRLGRD